MNFDDIKIKKAPLADVEHKENVKSDSDIIAKKRYKSLEIDAILETMINSIPKDINLVNVLINDIGDVLIKYRDKDNNIETTKIPDNIYIVAIVHKLMQISNQKGWDIAKENEAIYLFNGSYWVQCPKDNIHKFFNKIARKMGFYSPAKAETSKFKDDMYKQFIASASFYNPKLKNGVVLLNCKNGTLEVTAKTVTLREHDKEDFLKYVLPFEYNPNTTAPIFQKYLNDVLDNELQVVLQEFCGYIFVSNLKLEKCLVCFGSGANGKSVFFEIITSLLGSNNIATNSLGDLTDNSQGSYNRAMIKDCLVNYGSEIKGKNIDVDIFKRLVSGEPVQARLPYGQPFDLKNNSKFIFNANELPRVDEHNEAVFRRFIIIPFEKTIPVDKRDSELHTKIVSNELSGVLNWILIGLERLLQNKKFSQSDKVDNALNLYKKESDTVALFVEENEYIPSHDDTNDFKSIQRLYDEYKEATKNNGSHPLRKNNFSSRLKILGFVQSSKKLNGHTSKGYLVKQAS